MADFEPQASYWYTLALERLVGVVRELSQARDLDTITTIVRVAARELTGADGATFVLRDDAQCYYADEDAIAPLWKGKRFPLERCLSGWVMLNRQSVVLEDIYADPRIPAEAYRPTFVKSLAMVPIRRTAPVGAIGNYWSRNYLPSPEQVAILEALADTASVALQNAELYAQLQLQVQKLQSQQARIQAQHSSLEVFTLALAHDLREPVRTLVSYSGILREDRKDQQEQKDRDEAPDRSTYMRYIHNAAGRLDMMIDAVAQYTRLDELAPLARARCQLSRVFENVRDNLAGLIAARGATLHAGYLPELNADPAHLTLLLQNLIGNAMLHNEQPFRRLTHRDGCSGLGLAICRRICALYGGEIRCDSRLGFGTTFTFTLPATEMAELDAVFAQAD